MKLLNRAGGVTLTVFILSVANAATEINNKDIQLEADQVVCEQDKGICRASGNVIVIAKSAQKERTLKAKEITITFNESSAIDKISANGNVYFTSDGIEATAHRADYRHHDNVIIATGNVTINEKGSTLKGDHGKINLNSKTYEISQSNANRVQGTIKLK